MANKYWAAGVFGNWNSILSWSDFATGTPAGALVPGVGDDVFFNANAGFVTATLDISPDVKSLNCSGFLGSIAFNTNTISLNGTGTIFTGSTTMSVLNTPLIICTNSSATSRTISPGAVTEANSISFRVTAGTGSLTVATGAYRDLDFTDGVNPTGFAGAFSNNVQTVYGNFKASTGMTRVAGASALTFAATSGTKTINTAGVTFDCPFSFTGVGGTWQLQAALTSGATRTTTLTAGTLDLNGYTFTSGNFNSNNSNVRTLAFGTGKIVLTATSGGTWTTSTSTNLTVTGTNPLIQATVGGAGTRTITMGAAGESNAISVDVTAGSDTISFGTTSGAFKNVNFTGFTGTYNSTNTISCYGNWNWGGVTSSIATSGTNFAATSGTKTITSNGKSFSASVTFNGIGGTWECQDAFTTANILTMTNGTLKLKSGTTSTVGSFATSGTNPKYLLSTTSGTAATISDASGTNTVNYLTVQDSIATGGATWDALAITNVDAGNNTGWLFSTTPSIGNEITMRLRSFTQPRRF